MENPNQCMVLWCVFWMSIWKSCQTVTVPSSCDFEEGSHCASILVIVGTVNANFTMTIQSGPTPTANTGPDGAYSGRYYVYAERDGHGNGQTAAVRTVGDFTGTICLSFAYHMYGNNVGSLAAVYVYVHVGGAIRGPVLWEKSGNQGNGWYKMDLTVAVQGRDQILLFSTSTTSGGNRGDIALDAFKVVEGSCNVLPLPFECGFDTDICGMTRWPASGFTWRRYTGQTCTADTGPNSAYSGSHYIYAEANDGLEGDATAIETPLLNHIGRACIHFAYSMYGDHIGTLTATIYRPDSQTRLPLGQPGSKGQQWNSYHLDIDELGFKAKFVIRAVRGNGGHGDVAIDDLKITAGFCNECEDKNGGCNHTCIDLEEGYSCSCHDGYELADNEKDCDEVNECSTDNGGCGPGWCENTDGSYTCHCDTGYRLAADKPFCRDIDDCAENPSVCQNECVNTEGGYTCHCPRGYKLHEDRHSCVDCTALYVERHKSSRFSSACDLAIDVQTVSTLDECMGLACAANSNVINYLDTVCEMRSCPSLGNLQLTTTRGGWGIFVYNASALQLPISDMTTSDTTALPVSVSLWVKVVVPVMCVLVIAAVISGVLVYKRRRNSSASSGESAESQQVRGSTEETGGNLAMVYEEIRPADEILDIPAHQPAGTQYENVKVLNDQEKAIFKKVFPNLSDNEYQGMGEIPPTDPEAGLYTDLT